LQEKSWVCSRSRITSQWKAALVQNHDDKEPRQRLTKSTQTVVITGGSQGMGRGVAKLLASKGANVVIVARDVTKLKKAIEYISVSDVLLDCEQETNHHSQRRKIHQRKDFTGSAQMSRSLKRILVCSTKSVRGIMVNYQTSYGPMLGLRTQPYS
jgi:nucleoside-diphosphate-sugar epimerase